jgi:hypothetical protein
MTITVQGVANGTDNLFVYVATTCGSDPEGTAGIGLSPGNGTPLTAGSFTETYSYTPTSATTYALCAYLVWYNGPNASATGSFTAAAPYGSLAFSVSSNPIATLPATITVSGSSQIARDLYAYAAAPGSTCSDEPSSSGGDTEGVTALATGAPIAAGSFSQTYSYTPAGVGTYTLCAYLGDDSVAGSPEAEATDSFTASSGAATAPPGSANGPTPPSGPPSNGPTPPPSAAIAATGPSNGTTFVKPPVQVTFNVASPSGDALAGQVDLSTNPRNLAGLVSGSWGPGQHTVTLPIRSAGVYYWKVVGSDGRWRRPRLR